MQEKCARSNKFVEAELCKQRIATFKKKEKEKVIEQIKQYHDEQNNQLDIEKREELDEFNKRWDVEYFELRDKHAEIESNLKQRHQEEMDIKKEEIEKDQCNYIPKPSSEAINLNKIIENLVKLKE